MAFTGNTACSAFLTSQWTGGVNFATATFKLALYTNSATLGVDTAAYTSTGEVVASGYTAGGVTLTVTQQPVADGRAVYVDFADATFNAALTARGALLYIDGGPAVAVLDFGEDKTSAAALVVQFPAPTATAAILRLKAVTG